MDGIFNVNDSVWVAAAVLSYEKYYSNITNIGEYGMKQKDIRIKAALLNGGQKPEEARTSQWCNGNHSHHTHPYLIDVGDSNRLLSFPGYFGGGEIPDSLDDSIEIDTEVGKITIGELKRFVNTEYLEMKKQMVIRTNLRNFVEKMVNEYVQEKTKPFTGNQLGDYIRNKATRMVQIAGGISDEEYTITGSVGQGNWAMIPWLGVFNNKITRSATKGVYIVYLLAKDGKTLYLTFNQGCTELRKEHNKKETINIMRTNANKLINILDDHGFSSDENINLGEGLTELGELYQKGTIFYKAYKQGAIPTEPELEHDLKKMIEIYNQYIDEVVEGEDKYWPSKEEYDPGLTVDQWIDILNDKEITTENNLRMFAEWLDYGKPASCSEIADYYGETKNFFNAGSSSLARRIVEKGKCQAPPDRDNENARWWPVIYVGRNAKKEEPGSYIWKLRDEVKQALEQIDLPDIKENIKMNTDKKFGLNTILYGPPGTGKTYNTVRIAVSICEPELNVDEMEYSEVLEKYRKLKKEGRIEFTTFHQSYGYEEFIEGIKPVMVSESGETNSKDIQYDVMPGAFKTFCEKAKKVTISDEGSAVEKTNPKVWCLLLDGTGESKLKTYCFEHSEIRIGWSYLPERITYETPIDTDATRNMLTNFQDDMEIGDIVVTQKAFDRIDAIGIITSDYEFDTEALNGDWPRKRSVKWMAKEIDEDLYELNGNKHLGRYTIYPLGRIKADDLIKLANKNHQGEEIVVEQETKPYVFIIDEINRGNISKIFGELITLIETTKRAGADEEMETTLPYSGDPFSVPNNVYILGTMNTADRSIALMDTALRRRFDFEEMLPDPRVIEGITVTADGETLDVAQMLRTINKRIEYLYDREHTIGHAFFTKLKYNNSIKCLAEIFKDNVVPLLQEYFYEDYEKIQLVLGDNDKSSDDFKFILDKKVNENEIFKKSPQLDLHEKTYEIQKGAFDKIRSYIEITETRKAEEESE